MLSRVIKLLKKLPEACLISSSLDLLEDVEECIKVIETIVDAIEKRRWPIVLDIQKDER